MFCVSQLTVIIHHFVLLRNMFVKEKGIYRILDALH